MNLQIDYLKTFIALAETKGFTKAGVQVNKSQSAVSMQIKRLEDEVGKKLLQRIGKTVKPTPEGNMLLKHAMEIVKDHDDAVGALSKPNLEGFIRFGAPKHYTIGVLPRLLAKAPPDLKLVGLGDGLPLRTVSNIVLHKTRKMTSEIIECFSDHVIQAFGEKV